MIERQLHSIANGAGPAANFTQSIRPTGSVTITFDDPQYSKHEPDASFKHIDAEYPGVVIEISYSQKRKDLGRLADDYILGSDGSIHAMVGVDVEYRQECYFFDGSLESKPAIQVRKSSRTRHCQIRYARSIFDLIACSRTLGISQCEWRPEWRPTIRSAALPRRI